MVLLPFGVVYTVYTTYVSYWSYWGWFIGGFDEILVIAGPKLTQRLQSRVLSERPIKICKSLTWSKPFAVCVRTGGLRSTFGLYHQRHLALDHKFTRSLNLCSQCFSNTLGSHLVPRNYLVISGHDAIQTEQLFLKHVGPNDAFVQADVAGARTCFVRNPSGTCRWLWQGLALDRQPLIQQNDNGFLKLKIPVEIMKRSESVWICGIFGSSSQTYFQVLFWVSPPSLSISRIVNSRNWISGEHPYFWRFKHYKWWFNPHFCRFPFLDSILSGGEVPPATLREAGTLALCHSSAWDKQIVISAWWVPLDQVTRGGVWVMFSSYA